MKTSPRTLLAFALASTLGAFAPARARAQDLSPNVTAAARSEFGAGVDASRVGDWVAAREHFARAYALSPQPQMLFNLAGAQLQTGRLVAAAEGYRRFLREVTSGPAAQHRAAAERILEQIEPRIARVRLRITGLAAGDRVTLDDRPVAPALLGAIVPLDPGHHAVVVARGEREVRRVEFDVADGATHTVGVVLPPAPRALVATTHPVLRREVPTRPRPAQANPSVLASPWFWIAAGVVLVGGGALGVTQLTAPRAVAGNVDGSPWSVP